MARHHEASLEDRLREEPRRAGLRPGPLGGHRRAEPRHEARHQEDRRPEARPRPRKRAAVSRKSLAHQIYQNSASSRSTWYGAPP